MITLPTEIIIPVETVPIKYGLGATEERGYELRRLGVARVLVVTDPRLAELGMADRARRLIEAEGIQGPGGPHARHRHAERPPGAGLFRGDIPVLAEGALKQQRLLAVSPRAVSREEVERLFCEAMQYW